MKVINVNKINEADILISVLEQDYVKEECENYESPFYCLKINTIEQFFWLVDEIRKMRSKGDFIFRGQRDFNWIINSSLERGLNGENIEHIEKKHFENFRKLSRGRINEQFLLRKTQAIEYKNELWAVGQHMGLKTPLIDWTRSIFVALYFAFEEKDNSASYRSLFCINAKVLDVGPMYVGEVVEPVSDSYGRLTVQQGLFLTRKALSVYKNILEGNKGDFSYILPRKFIISDILRDEIMDYLDFIGIRKETIYPDFIGVIKKANSDLEQMIS